MTAAIDSIGNDHVQGACPCGKGDKSDMERIPRTFMMKTLLFWLPMKRYRCYRCMRNRWVLGRKSHQIGQ